MPLTSDHIKSILKQLIEMPDNNNVLAFYLSASTMAGFLNYVSRYSSLELGSIERKFISYLIKLKRSYFEFNRVDSIDSEREFILRKFINKLSKKKGFIDISFIRDELQNSRNYFDLIKVISTLLYFTFMCDCYDQFRDDFNYIINSLLADNYIQIKDDHIRDYLLLIKEVDLIYEL